MAGKKARPPKLPDSAPQDVKDFVACRRSEVQLDPTRTDWLPGPPGLPVEAAPSVNVTPSGTPGATNAVDVSVGWGFVSIQLPVSVVGGELRIDTANLPDFGGMKANVDSWVNSFNGWMKSNGKELAGLDLRNGRVHLTKRPIGVVQPGHSSAPSRRAQVAVAVALAAVATGAIAYTAWPESDRKATSAVAPTTAASTGNSTPGPTPAPTTPPTPEATLTADTFDIPDDFWQACDPAQLPCFSGSPPLVVWNGQAGITHNGSVPDALTGTVGPSQTEFPFRVVGPVSAGARLQVQTQCGSNLITGESALVADSVVLVQHPLYSYGQCQPVALNLVGDPGSISLTGGNWAPYEVGPQTVPAAPPDTADLTAPKADSLHAAGTTLGLLAGEPLAPSCTWLRGPDDANAVTPACAGAWTFTAGAGDARVVAHGGGYLSTPSDGSTGGPTSFPCGAGPVGYTVCVDESAVIDASSQAVVSVSFDTLIPDMPPGAEIEVIIGDTSMVVAQGAAGGTWTLDAPSAPAARAILRGNAATFMMPSDLLPPDPTYTVTISDGPASISQAPQQLLGALTVTAADAPPPDETESLDGFLAQLSQSLASDAAFAFDRLHPLVVEAYGAEACRAELQLPTPPDFAITLDAVGEDAPWTWRLPDGRSFDLLFATTVTLRIPGIDSPVDSHLVIVAGQYTWFTFCDGQ